MNLIRYFCTNIYNRRGLAFEKKGEYEKAIHYYTKAITAMPRLAIPYCNRANMYHRIHEYDKAITDYRKAIELNPRYSEAHNGLGSLYFNVKQYALAESCFRAAVQMNPRNDVAFSNLGAICAAKADYENAIKYYDRAVLSGNPRKLYSYYYNRGTAYAQKGDLLKAIQDFSKAIELNPGFAAAYHNRGLAYKNIGDAENSKKDSKRAEELGSTEREMNKIDQSYKQNWRIYKNRTQI